MILGKLAAVSNQQPAPNNQQLTTNKKQPPTLALS